MDPWLGVWLKGLTICLAAGADLTLTIICFRPNYKKRAALHLA